MAVKTSGAISFNDLVGEFGTPGNPISLSAYYRGGGRVPNGPTANANIATSGAINFQSFYGSIKEFLITLTATTTNYDLLTDFTNKFGAPSGAQVVRLAINSGVQVGSTTTTPALNVGQFPSGSVINIDNAGTVTGMGGAANSGTGGDAIKADYPNQTVNINNTSGSVWGGGGGGGRGGNGGNGGQGGAGFFDTYGAEQYDPRLFTGSQPNYAFQFSGTSYTAWWAGAAVQSGTATGAGPWGVFPYRSGTFRDSIAASTPEGGPPTPGYDYYSIQQGTRTNTVGGTGGTGGVGSAGGTGVGYNQASSGGVASAAGGTGATGGTNAGKGGNGGPSGAGGAGGALGQSGIAGGSGTTGLTGANGNNGSGVGGAAGSAGTAGGLAGFYLIKGTANVTLTGGTVGGRLG